MRSVRFLAILLMLVASVAQARDAAITDPPPDAKHPAANRQVLVPSGGEEMNALFLLASGAGPKPTVVLLHGLPGNEQNLDLAQAIRRAGWNVLTLHYRGSWGSPGKFSIANAVEDAGAALAFVRQPAVAEKFGVDLRRLVVGGHSMGGFAAARQASTDAGLAGLILIDAWNAGASGKALRADPSSRGAFVAGFDDLGHSLAGADAESLTAEVEKSGDDWNLLNSAPALAKLPVLTIWADRGLAEDNAALADAITRQGKGRLISAHFPSDHAFADHRIALSQAVVRWLQALDTAPPADKP